MTTIAREDFTNNLFQLLKETFEGPPVETGSAYLDKGAGLFQTLEKLTAASASMSPRPGAPSIAAHCAHAHFYVVALHELLRGGTTGKIDWQQSWLVRSVTTGEWESLKEKLRQAYASLVGHLQTVERWGDDEIGDALTIVVHTAYHLGAIRQLARTSVPE